MNDIEFEKNKITIVNTIIDNKLMQNEEYIRITFFEVRVGFDLNERQEKEIVKLATNKLVNMNYNVYTDSQKYTYKEANTEVHLNELIIAIKK